MQRLIFTTIKEGKIKLIMLIDIADRLTFPCIYYNGWQSLVAIRANLKVAKQQMRRSIKEIMFSNTNRKIHRRKQLASKVIQVHTQSNSTKKSFHAPSSSPQNQTSRFKIAIIGEKKHCNNINILSRTNVVQFSKAIGSCAQKAKILVVTAEFRTNNLPFIMILEPGQLY